MAALTDLQVINTLATLLETAAAQLATTYSTSNAPYSVQVLQNNQPSLQGAPTGPTCYFEKLFDREYGFPMVDYAYVPPVAPAPQGTFTQTEAQWTETTFQVSAQAIQDPENLSVPTASDIVNYMKLYINSRAALAQFKAATIGVLRITDIRNPKFKDDRNVFEANPNFDVVLQYKRQIVASVAATNIVQPGTVSGFEGSGTFPI